MLALLATTLISSTGNNLFHVSSSTYWLYFDRQPNIMQQRALIDDSKNRFDVNVLHPLKLKRIIMNTLRKRRHEINVESCLIGRWDIKHIHCNPLMVNSCLLQKHKCMGSRGWESIIGTTILSLAVVFDMWQKRSLQNGLRIAKKAGFLMASINSATRNGND